MAGETVTCHISFISAGTPGRAKKWHAPTSSLGIFIWIPGAVLNWLLLEEARRVERQTGQAPPGLLGLRVLMALFVTVPLVVFGGLLVLGLVGGLLAAALA